MSQAAGDRCRMRIPEGDEQDGCRHSQDKGDGENKDEQIVASLGLGMHCFLPDDLVTIYSKLSCVPADSICDDAGVAPALARSTLSIPTARVKCSGYWS